MLPYIQVNDLMIGPIPKIGTIPLHPFGLLVATGVLLGTALATWRARRRGVDLDLLNSFITWMLVAGFTGGHMLDQIFYHPSDLARIEGGHLVWVRPQAIFMLWEGLSSFGGFVGGFLGILAWKFFYLKTRVRLGSLGIPWFARRPKSLPILPFCDIILSVFPVAWIFGRSGCSVVHDHPGAPSAHGAWLAVEYPFASPHHHPKTETFVSFLHGDFPRYDLGTLELIFTIALAALFALTWSRRLSTGTYCAVVALAYAPVRFAMDYLRIDESDQGDLRYGSLTPAQWGCILMFAAGVGLALYVRRQRTRGIEPMDAVLLSARAEEPPPGGDAPSPA